MTKVATNKFLDLARRSALIDEARLTAFLDKATLDHGEGVLEDQERLAGLMIEAGLMTRWQADKLLAGKHRGFRLGKYKLLGQIGKGGMSSVYLAEHELMKRRVAIKVLPHNRVNDSSYLERFRLEARAVAKLDDPNIVRAYDIDNEGNTHYIVMEYVDGQDLHQIIMGRGPWTSIRPPITSPRSPTACNTRMKWAWCTATSSRPIAWWIGTTRSSCSISAWPS